MSNTNDEKKQNTPSTGDSAAAVNQTDNKTNPVITMGHVSLVLSKLIEDTSSALSKSAQAMKKNNKQIAHSSMKKAAESLSQCKGAFESLAGVLDSIQKEQQRLSTWFHALERNVVIVAQMHNKGFASRNDLQIGVKNVNPAEKKPDVKQDGKDAKAT